MLSRSARITVCGSPTTCSDVWASELPTIGSRLPSEWTVCRWRSPRYQLGPVPGTDVGARTGSNTGPGDPNVRVTSIRQSMPWGAIVYGPSRTCHRPGSTYPGVASDRLIENDDRAPPL